MLTLRKVVELLHPGTREFLATAPAFDAAAEMIHGGTYLGFVPDIGRMVLLYRPRDPRRSVADVQAIIAIDVAAQKAFFGGNLNDYPDLPEPIEYESMRYFRIKFHNGLTSIRGRHVTVTYNERREVVLRGHHIYIGCGVFAGGDAVSSDPRATVIGVVEANTVALPCGLLVARGYGDHKPTYVANVAINKTWWDCDDYGEEVTGVRIINCWFTTHWMQLTL